MEAVRIVLLCVVAAVCYGVTHDQITARMCVEYFTLGHPPIFDTEDPTLLGLGWGILATWWVGVLLGLPLAVAARSGARTKRPARSLIRPVALLLCVTAAGALLAGITGWILGALGAVYLVGPIADDLPPDRHVPLLAVLWAHSASYLFGLIGGCGVVVRTWRSRASATRQGARP